MKPLPRASCVTRSVLLTGAFLSFLFRQAPAVAESDSGRYEYSVTLRELDVIEQRLLWRSGEARVWLTDSLPAGTLPFPPPNDARETPGSSAAGSGSSGRSRSTVAGIELPWLLCAPAAPSGVLPELFSPFGWSGVSLPISGGPPVRPLTGWQRPGKRYGLALSLPAGTFGAAFLVPETALSASVPDPVPSIALAYLRTATPRPGNPWAFLSLIRSLPRSPLSETGYEDDPYYRETPEFLGGAVFHALVSAAVGDKFFEQSRVPVSFELGALGAGSVGPLTAPGWLLEGYGKFRLGSVEKLTVIAATASDRFVTPEGKYPKTAMELSVLNELSLGKTFGFSQRYGRRVKRFFPVPGAYRETEERYGGTLSYSTRLGQAGTFRTALDCRHDTEWTVNGTVEWRTIVALTAGVNAPGSKEGLSKVNFSLKGSRERGIAASGLPEPESLAFRASLGASALLSRGTGRTGHALSFAAAAAFSYDGKPRFEAALTLKYARAGNGGFIKVFTKKPVPWQPDGEGSGPPSALFPEYVTVSIGWNTSAAFGGAGAGKGTGAPAGGAGRPADNDAGASERGTAGPFGDGSPGDEPEFGFSDNLSEIEHELGDLEIDR
jgi:hypothetical protein